MQFLIAPLLTWGSTLFGKQIILPPLDTGTLMTLLGGQLGLGSMRTVEKINGVSPQITTRVSTPGGSLIF